MSSESLCETCRHTAGCPLPGGTYVECPSHVPRNETSDADHQECVDRFQTDIITLRKMIRECGVDPRPERPCKRFETIKDRRGRLAGERNALLMQLGELVLETRGAHES